MEMEMDLMISAPQLTPAHPSPSHIPTGNSLLTPMFSLPMRTLKKPRWSSPGFDPGCINGTLQWKFRIKMGQKLEREALKAGSEQGEEGKLS